MFASILGPIMIVVGLIGVLACLGMLAYSHWPRTTTRKERTPSEQVGESQ